jgi:NAD+ kinase
LQILYFESSHLQPGDGSQPAAEHPAFFDELTRAGITPVVFKSYLHEIKGHIALPETTATFATHDELTQDIDFLISLGGDGTLLDTVTLVRNKRIPVVGINFGRLGFLASIGRDELSDAVKALASRSVHHR